MLVSDVIYVRASSIRLAQTLYQGETLIQEIFTFTSNCKFKISRIVSL